MFNLRETRLTVKEIYLRWVPQIVMDSHQMTDDGPRMFIPPYQDPVEPNVDPILVENLNDLGLTVRKELIEKGLTGIVNRTLFDAWSPSRAYMHYHGGVRFLCEIASCRLATPIERKGIDRRATTRPDLNPVPWKGDRWALADVVRYHNETALAVLRHASRHRERWITCFHEVFRKACASEEGPAAIELRVDPLGWTASKLDDVLALGGVEASVDWNSGLGGLASRVDRHVVIPRKQPFFSFAKALLTTVPYPSAASGSGLVSRPYDVTAHALHRLLDIDEFARDPSLWPDDAMASTPSLDLRLRSPSSRDGALRFFEHKDPGSIAIYRTWVPNAMDEGWTRLFLDLSKVPYGSLENGDFREWTEARKPEVLIFPSMTADMIVNGNRAEEFPPEYRGGLGEPGVAWLVRFVREGGTLIALNEASALPIQVFRLPLRNALATVEQRVDAPGSILSVEMEPDHPWQRYPPLMVMDFGESGGSAPSFPAMFYRSKAFEPDLGPDRDHGLKPRVVARWAPAGSLLLAGHAEGLDLVAGKAAVVQCDVGRGQVILFGFPPQFRCQTWATFPLLRNAIASGLERN
jgi:hypothetical protein